MGSGPVDESRPVKTGKDADDWAAVTSSISNSWGRDLSFVHDLGPVQWSVAKSEHHHRWRYLQLSYRGLDKNPNAAEALGVAP